MQITQRKVQRQGKKFMKKEKGYDSEVDLYHFCTDPFNSYLSCMSQSVDSALSDQYLLRLSADVSM